MESTTYRVLESFKKSCMMAATRKKVLFRKFSLSIAVLVIILRFLQK